MRKVPELSLLSYVNGDESDRLKFVDDLFYGLKDYGFIILTDHIVDQEKVDLAYDITHQFFNLDNETKLSYHIPGGGGQRGYIPYKTEHAKNQKSPDLKEFWHVGRELSPDSRYYNVYPKNVWPKEVSKFREIMSDLYRSMDATSVILLEAIGQGLDLPENFFKDMVADGNSVLRVIHYPPTQGEDVRSHIRAAAHEDINLITLLVGATSSGLELLDRDGQWLAVKSSPGQIVVDSGDMMARLTNNVLPATTHRVVNPDDDGEARFSMPFFVHPHNEASLKVISSCIGDGEKWPEINADDFLQQRLRENGLY